MRKIIPLAASVGLVATSTALAFAQSSTVGQTPGHRMQEKGSIRGEPGASGYSPGHQMQRKGSKRGQPGASGYAPGHSDSNTGSMKSGSGSTKQK
jgi:hypothetical protein